MDIIGVSASLQASGGRAASFGKIDNREKKKSRVSTKSQISLWLVLAAICGILGEFVSSLAYWLVGAGLFCIVIVMLISVSHLSSRVRILQNRQSEYTKTITTNTAIELHSMQVILQRFPECSIPTSGFSMRFSNLHAIVDLLDRYKPCFVIELGSGISTLCVAAWMKEHGSGRLISFDHDDSWAIVTRRHLRTNSLDEYAKVITAPLKPVESFGWTIPWYDLTNEIEEIKNVEMLIVDGPPASMHEEGLSRLPAYDILFSRLSRNAVVVLDDVVRAEEKTILELWLQRLPSPRCRIVGGVSKLAVIELGEFSRNSAIYHSTVSADF